MHAFALQAMALHPGNRLLATGDMDFDHTSEGAVIVWDLVKRAPVLNHSVGVGGVGWGQYSGALQWSPSGQRLGMAIDTNAIAVLAPVSGQMLAQAYVTEGDDSPPPFCWGPNDEGLFVGCFSDEHDASVCAIAGTGDSDPDTVAWLRTPGGGDIVALSFDSQVGVLRLVEGDALVAMEPSGRAHGSPVSLPGAMDLPKSEFSRDASRFAAVSGAGLSVYDARSGQVLGRPLNETVDHIVWSGDVGDVSTLAAVVGPRGKPSAIVGWTNGTPTWSIDLDVAPTPWLDFPDLRSWSFSPDGTKGVALNANKDFCLYSLDGNQALPIGLIAGDPLIQGVVWGRSDTLVGLGPTIVAFWDIEQRAQVSRYVR